LGLESSTVLDNSRLRQRLRRRALGKDPRVRSLHSRRLNQGNIYIVLCKRRGLTLAVERQAFGDANDGTSCGRRWRQADIKAVHHPIAKSARELLTLLAIRSLQRSHVLGTEHTAVEEVLIEDAARCDRFVKIRWAHPISPAARLIIDPDCS